MLLGGLNEILLVSSQNKCLINVNSLSTNFPKEHKIFSSTKFGRKVFYLTDGTKLKEQEVLSSETTYASFYEHLHKNRGGNEVLGVCSRLHNPETVSQQRAEFPSEMYYSWNTVEIQTG